MDADILQESSEKSFVRSILPSIARQQARLTISLVEAHYQSYERKLHKARPPLSQLEPARVASNQPEARLGLITKNVRYGVQSRVKSFLR
jgi:hypothetical protein